MRWPWQKDDTKEEREDFLRELQDGKNYLAKDYKKLQEHLSIAMEEKRKFEDKIKNKFKHRISEDEYFIIYDLGHHRCKESLIGYCGTIRNWRTSSLTDKSPCVWCGKKI